MPKAQVSNAKRLRIYQRDNYTCWYCGRRLVPATTSAFGTHALQSDKSLIPTLDHLDPRIRGGYGLDSNLVTACQTCNSRKGSKTVEEYRAFLAKSDKPQELGAAEWIRGRNVEIIFWGERKKAA